MDWRQASRAIGEARGAAVAARVLLDTAGASPAAAVPLLAEAWGRLEEAVRALPDAARPLPRPLRLLPWLPRGAPGGLPAEIAAQRERIGAMLSRLRDGEPIDAPRGELIAGTAALGRAVAGARALVALGLAPAWRRRLWLLGQGSAALATLAALLLLAAGIHVFATTPGVSQGLTGFYWRSLAETGGAMERIDHGINFSWGTGAPFAKFPADNFSARWEGCVVVDEGDRVLLEAGGDDAIRVVVEGRTEIDDWKGGRGFRVTKAKRPLGPGKHPIRVTYQERTGYARAYLGWSRNGGPGVPIPPANLLPRTVVAQSGASDSGCPGMPSAKKK